MSRRITAIILTDNNADGAGLTYKSLQSFGGDLLEEVLVYNYEQTEKELGEKPFDGNYTYVAKSTEKFPGFPSILNRLINNTNSENNILVLCKGMMITPGCLERLDNALVVNEKAGIAVGYANGFGGNQALPKEISDYRLATEYATSDINIKNHRITLCNHKALLLNKSAFDELRGLKDRMMTLSNSITDFCFRLTLAGFDIVAVPKAAIWDTISNVNEPVTDLQYWGGDYEILKEDWGIGYYNRGGNRGIINLIKKNENDIFKVLEIGCSKGDTLLDIKEKYPNSEVFGVELDGNATKLAAHFCKAIQANIEDEALPYNEEEFDYVILADVLEHLHNPQKSLEYIRKFIKPGGAVLASIPNVQHISVVKELLRGYFTYTPVGLLDHTHIHLFTWNEIARMFDACKFKIEVIGYTLTNVSGEEKEMIGKLRETVECSDAFMFEAFQYVFKADKI